MPDPDPTTSTTADPSTAATAPGAAPPAPQPPQPPPTGDPAWLNPRLEQARRSAEAGVLQQLGVATVAEAQAALTAHRAAVDAQRTEAERTAARIAQADAAIARAAQLETAVRAQAEVALAGLTAEQRAAVEALAGSDPARIVTSIAALRPTWAAPVASTPTAPPPAAPQAPATTAPATPPPNPAHPGSPTNHKSQYELLLARNPIQAAAYAERHGRQIWPDG